jgi:serine/threonine protein kinase
LDHRERSKALICRNLFNDPSDLLRIERYELVRTLGCGGMGVVYEVVDPLRGERVALKALNGRSAADLYRLKREFRSLAELAHPNLVALRELSVAPQHAFFTMELVHGKDIVSYIRAPTAGAWLDPRRLRSALTQLCDGIHALHQAGKLHLDLKPSNVLVTEAGRVVLLDFGLVQDVREQGDQIAGTPLYMAPEQHAGNACESSDWFAFGRILQQALGGRSHDAPWSDGAASELSRLVDALLEADPDRRAGWREVSSIVHGGPSETRRAAARRPRACPHFLGRTAELSTLARAFARSLRQPTLVLLRGKPGAGKTALMRQFARSVRDAVDAVVLNSRCYEREFVPFKALDSAVDELSRHLTTTPIELPSLSADDRRALVQLFPVLGRVPALLPDTAGEKPPPLAPRRRGFDALKKLLRALTAGRPLLLCIDDMQWSDAESGALLAALLCDDDAPPLLVLCGDRTESGHSQALEELHRASERASRPAAFAELTLETPCPRGAAGSTAAQARGRAQM